MKRFLFLLVGMLPLFAQAEEQAKYLRGAVPEKDGIVVFSQTYNVPTLDADKALQLAIAFIQQQLMEPAIQEGYTRMLSDAAADGVAVARVEEYMVFRHQVLNLDRTRFRYQVTAQAVNGQLKVDISQISYYYNEDEKGLHGIHYKAEEWITDAESVNKKGTKLYPRSGKFRRKTIDRVEVIFAELGKSLS